jgi:hypothetical protein
MIKGLPRPFLWTEIKTMDEFLKGDFLTEVLYGTFKDLHGSLFLPYVDEVAFFNELFYQLTRYYYEKPKPDDYIRYVADIRSNLGQVCYADLVMIMMFHYCRLKNISYPIDNDGFMRTVRFEQEQKEYWQFFSTIKSTVFRWIELVPYPQKPCPVAPRKLDKMKLNWDEITHDYNLSAVKEILNLWNSDEDKRAVASMIRGDMRKISTNFPLSQKYNDVKRYLTQIMNGQDEKVTHSKQENIGSENKKFMEAALFISEHTKNKELEEKDKEILQLKKEREKYRTKVTLLEKKNKELQQQHEDDIAKLKKHPTEQPTEDDFVKRLVKETKNLYKHERSKTEVIRQILYKLGRADAEAELDAWIEGKEKKTTSMKFENAQVTMQQPTINGPMNDIHDNDQVSLGS